MVRMPWSVDRLTAPFWELAEDLLEQIATAAAANAIGIDIATRVNPDITQFALQEVTLLRCKVLPFLQVTISVAAHCDIAVLIPLVGTMLFQR